MRLHLGQLKLAQPNWKNESSPLNNFPIAFTINHEIWPVFSTPFVGHQEYHILIQFDTVRQLLKTSDSNPTNHLPSRFFLRLQGFVKNFFDYVRP